MKLAAKVLVFLLSVAACSRRNDSAESASVVVVGGGLAGLTSAYELQKRGIKAHVLEERPIWGGRVGTATYADGVYAEYGMQEIWEDNPLRSLAEELSVPMDSPAESAFSSVLFAGQIIPYTQPTAAAYFAALLGPELQPLQRFMAGAQKLYGSARKEGLADPAVRRLQDLSMADWVAQANLPERAAHWLQLTLECEMATDWQHFSALSGLLDMEMFFADGLRNYHVRGGNQKIVDALVGALRGPTTSGAAVTAVTGNAESAWVHYEKDHQVKKLRARYVVLAVPFVRLHQLYLDPPMPADYWSGINSLNLGQYTVVHLATDANARALWAGANPFPVLAGGTLGVIYGVGPSAAQRSHDIFSLLLYGDAAKSFHMVPRAAKTQEVIEALGQVWPQLPQFVQGAYTYTYHPASLPVWPPGRSPLDTYAATLRSPFGNVYLAGDYTRGSHATAAVQSGIDVAQQIASALGK